MSRQVTVAGSNRYCQARLRAAKYNEDFASRTTAVTHLPGVTEDSLKKYELDITRPPNDVIALMADAYNEPELRSWYCATECPLGKDCRCIEDVPAERTVLRLQNVKGTIENVTEALSDIMDDGMIDKAEAAMIPELRKELLEATPLFPQWRAATESTTRGIPCSRTRGKADEGGVHSARRA